MGYEVIEQAVEVAGRTWTLTTLKDRQQFHDPDGELEAAGVAPATWPLFGVVWSAGILLAEAMTTEPIERRRILEVGCGLGIASLVLKERRADILATDIHPLAGEFLAKNAAANDVETPPFLTVDWRSPPQDLGQFDLIVGSDLLYERDQPEGLAEFMSGHCREVGNVIITDPGRNQTGAFSREMRTFGFHGLETRNGRSRLIRYSRSTRAQ
jgi:predicted nicotinamide N-methyase